jgi:hypothetical protein
MDLRDLGRMLLLFGAILLLVGTFFYLGGKLPFRLGRLPGDIPTSPNTPRFTFPSLPASFSASR